MRFLPSILLALLALTLPGRALKLELDFSYDAQDFFGTHADAKPTLLQAAADLSAALAPTKLTAVTDVFTATVGGATATIDWNVSFTNPSSGASVNLPTFSLAADTVRVFVGMRALSGNTLGVGGPGGAGYGISVGGTTAQRGAALDQAEAKSNAAMGRGAGAVMQRSTTSVGTTGSVELAYGALFGNLWFDNDSNNDAVADNDSLLNSYWHFSLATLPSGNKNDFYSVAVHELLHTLGFGTSLSWTGSMSGTTWLGAEAIAENGGTGANLVSGGHLRLGYMSQRISDGAAQEAIMSPALTTGTRRYLTEMDLAILRDLGYLTIPEPSSAACTLVGGLFLLRRRRRARGQ